MAGKKTVQTFQALYKKLNSEQKTAVDAIEGPVMVIAGPGTGKTQVLTLRIANILKKTDTPPDAVLALTFTESAARSMQRRLVDIIGPAGYRVHIHTFHGFCNDVIQQYPEAFPRIIGAVNITDADKVGILKDIILNDNALTLLRPFGAPLHHIGAIRQKISELKRENVTPERLASINKHARDAFERDETRYHARGQHKGKLTGEAKRREKQLLKNEELARIYAAYEKALAEQGFYDYEDMIMETIRALEADEGLLRTLQEEYHYILADEHQDANAGQNRLLELLASYHDSPNLFVVGDEKQAIFRFQGASLENFLYFKKQYPGATLVTLEKNYRSRQPVLDAAHAMITAASGEGELRKPLVGRAGDSSVPAVRVGAFSRPEYEYRFLAEDIRQRIDEEGAEPSEIAVLYRTNRDAEPVVRAFEQIGIPFTLESEQNVLTDPDIQKLFRLFRAIANFGDDEALAKALHIDFLSISPLDAYKLIRYASFNGIPLTDALRLGKHRKAAGVSDSKALERLFTLLERFKTESEGEPLPVFFERAVYDSGFVPHLLASPYAADKLEKLHRLFSDVEALNDAHRDYRLREYLHYIDLLEEHKISIAKDTKNAPRGAVRLMTAHKAKGLEFDYVYIIRAADGNWGNRRSTETFDIQLYDREMQEEDDERRLFYVALTRAREQATVTYPRENENGREQLPSQFVGEMEPETVAEIDTAAFEKTLAGEPLIAPRRAQKPTTKDEAFLAELFFNQGLSVTALNNYLRCPWQYFYRNLLRIPEARDRAALYGTAMHATLKDIFEHVRRGETPSAKQACAWLETHMGKQPFAPFEYKEALARGKEAITGYLKMYSGTWEENVLTEFHIATTFAPESGTAPPFPIRGVLDKLEFINDNRVVVVDYKTGAPKSRNHILGKTKAKGAGDYYRQLVFYKLLLDSYENGKYAMEAGEIDFIEPNDRGKYKKERFTISDAEVQELSKTIQNTAQEITTLSFWDTRCDDAACQYCALRELMH